MKKQKKINVKQLESHCKIFNIKMGGMEFLKVDAATIDAIEEAYADGAKIRMRLNGDMLVVQTTHDYLKGDSLIDVTSRAPQIIKDLRSGRISFATRGLLQNVIEETSEIPVLIFEIEASVNLMMEEVSTLQKWMERRKTIWRISVKNSNGICLAVAYVCDQKYFDWTKLWLKGFISRKATYQHNLKIQKIYEEELVNSKVAKLFEADLQCSGFIPVKSGMEEAKKIQRVLKTAAWVNERM